MRTLAHDISLLQELAAPAGWTAALLESPLPLGSGEQERYLEALAELRRALSLLLDAPETGTYLLFERCRPEVEIPLLQQNGRAWMPQIGMGVWPDREPPVTWTAEEFAAAAPGSLRPVIDRVFRLNGTLAAQDQAWQMLAGSGALIGVLSPEQDRFLQETSDSLRSHIADLSLTGFPFYLPLMTGAALQEPSEAFAAPLDNLLPHATAYLRESAEDGGVLILVRQEPRRFWRALAQQSFAWIEIRYRSPGAGQEGA